MKHLSLVTRGDGSQRSKGRWLAAALVIALAPSGCSSADEPEYTYGLGEMRSAIEGTWEGTSRAAGASADAPMTMTLAYVAPDVKPLCGSRLLARDEPGAIGPLCIDSSEIRVSGTILTSFAVAEAAREVRVQGTFDVMSLRFDGHGTLGGDAGGSPLDATLASDVLTGTLRAGGGSELSFSLHRRK